MRPKKKKSEKQTINKEITRFWEIYQKYTYKLSGISRKLAFAEGGAFWLLKSTTCKFPTIIILGLFILTLFFISDALQYYFIMHDFDALANKTKERLTANSKLKLKDIDEDSAKKHGEFFFNLKLIFITLSSVLLLLSFTIVFQ